MIHLAIRTEHSFRYAIGQIPKVLDRQAGVAAAGIADRHGTWGHVKWAKECKRRNIKPIFGVELAVVPDMEDRSKQRVNYMKFIAKDDEGLRALYELVTLATEKFYWHPRISYSCLEGLPQGVLILSGTQPDWDLLPKTLLPNLYFEINPLTPANFIDCIRAKYPSLAHGEHGVYSVLVATCDNLYPAPSDKTAYQLILNERFRQQRTAPPYILEEWEWCDDWPEGVRESALENAARLAEECNAKLPKAEMVHPEVTLTLRQMCEAGKAERTQMVWTDTYEARLDRELELIQAKRFEDYFYVVADMVRYAKENMLVGPARGSSCGSLVCYLLGITDIDPIPFDLLFERFIDLNREDYPDIDIDFQEDRREMVFEYLREKYGADNVSRLGTVNLYKAKSALGDVAKALEIPLWEVERLKGSIIERSSGDARAAFCILDTFQELEVGRETLEKYPHLATAALLEGSAHHTGVHAAGIVITAQRISHYCAVDMQTGAAMLDKKDAESLDLLKIDALGLRTLSVIQDCLDSIGKDARWLREYPIDDHRAFAIINEKKFGGIFQFEGYALQSICANMEVRNFGNIADITALARPGPLNSGGASSYIRRVMGRDPVTYFHPLVEPITKVTLGIIVYQEQVMQIARTIGALSWENVSELRKAMSKSLGKEFFDKYWEIFWQGAQEKGLTQEEAQTIWDNINTMGSWAFNRSHAVAYGMMSYWCCVLKAYYPLEFAAACLRNAKDSEQSIRILRELEREGYSYKPYDRYASGRTWGVAGGVLVGGLTAIKGVGEKMAASIIKKRDASAPFTAREEKLLAEGVTPWDHIFPARDFWGHLRQDPEAYGINSLIVDTEQITADSEGTFVFIAKIIEKNLRDKNEAKEIEKRGGQRMNGQTLFLNLRLEDDTGQILAFVNRFEYMQWGKPIVEQGKIDDWYLWKGENRPGFRRIHIKRWKRLTGNEAFARKTHGT